MTTQDLRRVAALGALLTGSFCGFAAVAEEATPVNSFSANVALTTNYMFRGNSQTDNGPAVQGGFDYEYTPFGLYAGVWASNVDSSSGSSIYVDPANPNTLVAEDFPGAEQIVLEAPGYDGASMELDIYAGWRPNFAALGLPALEKLSMDLGYIRYEYPMTETDENNTNEWHIGISYDVMGYFTPGYQANFSEDWFGLDAAWYHDFSLEVPLPYDFTLHGNYGLTRYNNSPNNGGAESYDDYGAGVGYSFHGFDFDLSWVSRNKTELCAPPFQCGDTAVFTVSKSF